VKEREGKRSLFYKKAPQKIFDGWRMWHGSATAALEAALYAEASETRHGRESGHPRLLCNGVFHANAPRTKVFCGAFPQKSDPFP
jgi:hypothetical protein